MNRPLLAVIVKQVLTAAAKRAEEQAGLGMDAAAYMQEVAAVTNRLVVLLGHNPVDVAREFAPRTVEQRQAAIAALDTLLQRPAEIAAHKATLAD